MTEPHQVLKRCRISERDASLKSAFKSCKICHCLTNTPASTPAIERIASLMSAILHPSEDFSARIFRHNEAVIWEYRDAAKCVYGADAGKMKAVGSCIPIEIDGKRFLLTAAHVLDNLRTSQLIVGITRTGFMMPPTGGLTLPVNGKRANDIYDFGWIKLDDEAIETMKETRFFNSRDLSFDENVNNDYLAFGYPSSRNKPELSLSEITPRPTHYVAQGSRRDGNLIYIDYPKLGYYPELNMVKAPANLIGMSGGALINMGLRSDLPEVLQLTEGSEFRGKLAGLITEKTTRKEDGQTITEIRCTDMRFIFKQIACSGF